MIHSPLDTGRWRLGLGLAFSSSPGAQARWGAGGRQGLGDRRLCKEGGQQAPPGQHRHYLGCPIWNRPCTGAPACRGSPWSSSPAHSGRRKGALGDPCAHVPGRPGGRLWRGLARHLGPSILLLPHTSHQHFTSYWVLNVVFFFFFFKHISGKAVVLLLSREVCFSKIRVHSIRR